MDYQAWLSPHGLEQFIQIFTENELTLEDVLELNHAELKDGLGVGRYMDRKKILAAVEKLRAEQPKGPIAYPEGLEPDNMPAYLAHPWCAFMEEDHPRVKLHWLTDTAELAVRWAVALELAEVLHANDYVLPNDTARAVRDNIERPTLGRWLAVLRALCASHPKTEKILQGGAALYERAFAPHFEAGSRGASVDDSVLELRNQIAHGGGMSPSRAEDLLQLHQPRLEDMLRTVLEVSAGSQVYARQRGIWSSLMGEHPHRIDVPSILSHVEEDGSWLVQGEMAIPLLPLAIYEPVHVVDSSGELKDRPGGAVAQVFTRAYHDRLTYTPLGRDDAYSESLDVSYFRQVFRLDDHLDAKAQDVQIDGRRWDDAIREARVMAEELVGRKVEIKHIKTWLTSRQPREPDHTRLGWMGGGPGLGKSMIMSRLTTDYSGSKHRGLFYHRFYAGNARAGRIAFMRLLESALWAWAPLKESTEAPILHENEEDLIDALEARLLAIEPLESHHPRAPKPSFWVFLDGFDELASQDPKFIDVIKRLMVPGVVWLASGRHDNTLSEAFKGGLCEHIFENGLPVMSAADIRAMLMEGLGNARYTLLRQDEDDDDGVHNVFIERVVENAHGLPLYVQLLLDDLRAGAIKIDDDEQLPDGLGAYYDGLMERVGLSTVSRDLPMIVAALAISQEPLDASALAELLAHNEEDLEIYQRRVNAALRVSQSLLRRATTPEGTPGYTLYHQSFREYLTGRSGQEEEAHPAEVMAEVIYEAQRRFVRVASGWENAQEGNLRNHLFRWATWYAVEWNNAQGIDKARERLRSYAYLHARIGALDPASVVDLVSEYQKIVGLMPVGEDRDNMMVWSSFFRERAHLLARGDDSWPSFKILLQLSVEHADQSPVTQAAEQWMSEGGSNWLWMRKPNRPVKLRNNFALRVFEGHSDWVTGAKLLKDGRLCTWARDFAIRLWDMSTGEEIAALAGHEEIINGMSFFKDDTIAVSYDRTGKILVWDLTTGELKYTLEGHEKAILGVDLIAEESQWFTWSEDKSLRLWSWDKGELQKTMTGHTRPIRDAQVLSDGRFLSWSDDKSLRLWSQEGDDLGVVRGHTREVVGAYVLEDGRILSWDMDNMMLMWSGEFAEEEAPLVQFEGHTDTIRGVLPYEEALYTWSKDGTIRSWSYEGEEAACFTGHTDLVQDIMFLGEGRMLSWSKDLNLRIWNMEKAKTIEVLEGHSGWVRGAMMLSTGELLSWSGGGSLRIWDLDQDGKLLAVLEGHTAGVWGAMELEDQHLLSWSWDGSLRLWAWERDDDLVEAPGHRGWINGCGRYGDGESVATWATDGMAILWDIEAGTPQKILRGHEKSVSSVEPLDATRALTYGSDMTIRVWDMEQDECLHVLEAHEKKIQGVSLLGEDRAVSWSSDAKIKIWDLAEGSLVQTLDAHKKLVQGTQLFGDGKMLSWSSDATLKVWDLSEGEMLLDFKEHKKLLKGAKVLQDERVLSWSSDKTLKIWDIATGEVIHSLEEHKKIVENVRFLDNRRIISLSKDLLAIVWDLAEGQSLITFEVEEMPEGATLLDEDRILFWMKKAKTFVVRHMETGEVLDQISQSDAMLERPEYWQHRQRASRFATILEDWRGQGITGGAQLYWDGAEGGPVTLEWKETGTWMTMVLDGMGILTAHAGQYFYPLHVYHGSQRVSLAQAQEILST